MAINKISFEVNRGQYEFRLTNGLLEATHDQEVLMTSSISHNIDALSNIFILQRSEFSADLRLTDLENWNFDANIKLKGAQRRTETLRDLHSIEAKSNFRNMPNTKMAKSGDITISGVSPILPKNVRIHIDELGLAETALFTFEARAAATITVEAEQVLKVRITI